LVAVLSALAVIAAPTAHAGPPVASTKVATGEKTGVTLYQASGLKGSIPLKKVFKVDPSGDTGHYELEFASNKMNTEMEIMAKYVVPTGMTFQSFEVRTTNGPTQVTPAGADSWDGQTIIDKVTVSPWNMNRVLQQCVDQLKNGDGTFKDSATFDLEADSTEVIRGKGIAKFANAPPGNASSLEGTVKPRTRVTAYIVGEDRKGAASKDAKRVASPPVESHRVVTPRPVVRPAQPNSDRGTTRPAGVNKTPVATQPLPRIPSTRLGSSVDPTPAKDRFERNRPHVNVPARPAAPSTKPRVPQR
jgi:hypothetical protein